MHIIKTALMGVVLAAMVSCQQKPQSKEYRIEGDINLPDSSECILMDAMTNDFVGAFKVKDGKVVEMTGETEEPVFCVVLNQEMGIGCLMLEPGTIHLTINDSVSKAEGTPLNKELHWLMDFQNEIGADGMTKEQSGEIKDFIERNAQNPLCLQGLTLAADRSKHFDDAAIKQMLDKMRDKWGEHFIFQSIETDLVQKEQNAPGKMFRDFEATYEGKTTRLSDYVGKGKYVLVDFWASWCGPCRAEIPNLIKAYNTYKDKGLVVLGVATWDEPENTLKAIAEEGIPYPQMLNAQKAGSDAYSISGIPYIILFGPDGKIVEGGLRGEKIEQTLKEIFK